MANELAKQHSPLVLATRALIGSIALVDFGHAPWRLVMAVCCAIIINKMLKADKGNELTKSLLNLLYNIIRVGSVKVSATQRSYFDKHANLVLKLLAKSTPLAWKKRQLQRNLPLVLNIAASCPRVVGSS